MAFAGPNFHMERERDGERKGEVAATRECCTSARRAQRNVLRGLQFSLLSVLPADVTATAALEKLSNGK